MIVRRALRSTASAIGFTHPYPRLRFLSTVNKVVTGSSGNNAGNGSEESAKLYGAFHVGVDGSLNKIELSKSDLLAKGQLHMRDLLQLGLDVPFRLRHTNRLPPQILQRGDCILALMGPFQAIILDNEAFFFGTKRSTVRSALHRLKGVARQRYIEEEEEIEATTAGAGASRSGVEGGGGKFGGGGGTAVASTAGNTHPQVTPFELMIIEHILDELCSGYSRRFRLFQPVVSRLLLGLTHGTEADAMDNLHLLVPIKNGISNFQMVVSEAVECLERLLANDDDLLALLLTEHKRLSEVAEAEWRDAVAREEWQMEQRRLLKEEQKRYSSSELNPPRDASTAEKAHASRPSPTSNPYRPPITPRAGAPNDDDNFDDVREDDDVHVGFDEAALAPPRTLTAPPLKWRGRDEARMPFRSSSPPERHVKLAVERHEQVEVLLENYHRRLVLIRHQMADLMNRVKSAQEVTAIRIDVSRNRIIRTNLHLTMASVSLAGMTAVAGFFGMNLELPFWLDFGFTSAGKSSVGGTAFLATTAASVALGGGIYAMSMASANGWLRQTSQYDPGRLNDVVALGRIFENMSSIEHIVHEHIQERVTKDLPRSKFTALLAQETMRDVSEREVDLIFEIFDVDSDGVLELSEIEDRNRLAQ